MDYPGGFRNPGGVLNERDPRVLVAHTKTAILLKEVVVLFYDYICMGKTKSQS